MALKSHVKFLEKLACGLENDFIGFGFLLGPFIQSRKCMSIKFTGDLGVMTMKNDAKFEQELPNQFKIDMRNLRF